MKKVAAWTSSYLGPLGGLIVKRRYWLVVTILAALGYFAYNTFKEWERQWGSESR